MYEATSSQMQFWYHRCRFVVDLKFQDFLDDAGIANMSIFGRFFWMHQIQFACDHQKLACTPKDLPRRDSVKERSFRHSYCIELSIAPFEQLFSWNLSYRNIILCSIAFGNHCIWHSNIHTTPPIASDKLVHPLTESLGGWGAIISEWGMRYTYYSMLYIFIPLYIRWYKSPKSQ